MHAMQTRFKLALLLLLPPAFLHAQTTINVPADQPTIQAAINASSDGDTIKVAPGTYTENIDFKQKAIIVLSNGATAANPAIIDGGGKGPVVMLVGPFSSTGTVSLSGFTIRNGGIPQTSGGPQGAIYASNISGSFVFVIDNTITGGLCQGIYAINSYLDISDNDITQTLAPTNCPAGEGKGSGIFVLNGESSGGAAPGIMGNTIENNVASVAASGDKGGGAGINIANVSSIQIYQNIIRNNTTTGYGGGMFFGNSTGLRIEGNLIYGNKGVSGGIDAVIPGATTGPIVGMFANNTIAENSGIGTSSTIASDLYIGGNLAQYVFLNNIIVGYTNGQAAINCGAQYAAQTLTPIVFDHNDIYSVSGSTNKPFGGACTTPAGLSATSPPTRSSSSPHPQRLPQALQTSACKQARQRSIRAITMSLDRWTS